MKRRATSLCMYAMAYFLAALILGILAQTSTVLAKDATPVRIGLTAEYGLTNSTSAQAIEMGIRVALEEINSGGGVLGGRPLVLETRDDRSVPARGIANLRELATMPDMVAVFGARFSPVMIEMVPVAHELGVILLDPWSSADAITRHDFKPSYSFRLSLKDSLAMPALLGEARRRELNRVGLLLPNTAWGRSNESAATAYAGSHPGIKLVRSRWYNWGDSTFLALYQDLLDSGAEIVVLVANDREGSILLREVASLPKSQHRPILSHWGVTGGRFFEAVKNQLAQLDFSVVQTFSFLRAKPEARDRFMAVAAKLYPVRRVEDIASPVGVGHAYDLTHLLALAIDKAGSTDRAAVRAALEHLGPYSGLVADFKRPFSPENHDALGQESVFLARYSPEGVLVPILP